jgi:hypothetical protein
MCYKKAAPTPFDYGNAAPIGSIKTGLGTNTTAGIRSLGTSHLPSPP